MHSSLDVKVFRMATLAYDEIPHLSSVVAGKEVHWVHAQKPRTEREQFR
jgi:hypothetical protein